MLFELLADRQEPVGGDVLEELVQLVEEKSPRWSRARWTQSCTVARLTPKSRATCRMDLPRRTARTMARRRSLESLFLPSGSPQRGFSSTVPQGVTTGY